MSFLAPPSGLPAISPTRGEIRCRVGFRQSPMQEKALPATLPISPLVGEMSGRTEGGATERGLDRYYQDHPHELG
ncbi:MAG: propionyl-coenzyme A carboxylase alpha polypeptide [Mesorhizobium sp.]|nr:MAG: propionyl-coenzyme A carboxylase alpha polypeptide [Mesorhizobium sp.]